MEYITKEGDTLASIATVYTLSPTYADAIARFNDLTNDVMETPVNGLLEAGMYLQIPDEWIKPGTRAENIYAPVYTTGPLASTQGMNTPLLLAAVGLGAYAFMSGGRGAPRRRRSRRRRR